MSCTGKGTIANMGAEIGATTSTFGYDASMERYLKATGRAEVAKLANKIKKHLTADPEVYANPKQYFDQVIEIKAEHPELVEQSKAKEKAKLEYDKIVADAQLAITHQKNAAISEVKNQVGTLVVEVAEKVLPTKAALQ